jgi:hypothetical protein
MEGWQQKKYVPSDITVVPWKWIYFLTMSSMPVLNGIYLYTMVYGAYCFRTFYFIVPS